MANILEIVVKAKDEASGVLGKVGGSLKSFSLDAVKAAPAALGTMVAAVGGAGRRNAEQI